MYRDRLHALTRAYNVARRNNEVYTEAERKVSLLRSQLDFLIGMQAQLKSFDLEVMKQEQDWRQGVLSVLEAEIMNDLAFVYPADGYMVKLTSRILRGKIHIDATVTSISTGGIPGTITGTQGRLFQQVVSFGALEAVMNLLGVKTIYIDEAFSGSSKENVSKLNGLLKSLQDRGFNLVLIAQDKAMAEGIGANRLILSRSLDNKTTIVQEAESYGGEGSDSPPVTA